MSRVVAVILAVAVVGVGCTARDNPVTTVHTVSRTTVTAPPTPPAPDLAQVELLHAADLPEAREPWVKQTPLPAEFWAADSTAGITLHICENGWKPVASPPLNDLQAHAATAFESGNVHVFEVVFTDSDEAVRTAFDTITQNLTECLDNPDRWMDAFSPQVIEQDGWYIVADRLPLPSLGDERFAMQYTALTDDGGRLDHRMAVLRRRAQLVVVELSESWIPERLTNNNFNDIVQSAMDHLAP